MSKEPNYQNVTVRDLREALALVNQDAEVILATDEEGNGYNHMIKEVKGNEHIVHGIEPERGIWGWPLVVLYPYGPSCELDVVGSEDYPEDAE